MTDLSQFQNAAVQACLELMKDPYTQEQDENGFFRPRWTIYAERMAELQVILFAMRQHGMLP